MSNYIITHSDPSKPPIVITTGTVDNSTSLKLIGRNYPNFGQPVAENFLHMLENFCNATSPTPPTEGQLWFDTSLPSSKKLKVYDGTNWVPTGGVWQGEADPYSYGSKEGDIWVDTARQLLKIQTSAGWVLVGPTFSNSNRTGSYPDSIIDKDGNSHDVIFMYLNDVPIEIIAKESFTPLTVIDGFTNIVPGVNVSSKTFDGALTKVAGVATSAAALRQTSPATEIVSANNFIRNDIDQITNGAIRINNNSGLQIGQTTATFKFEKNGRDAVITNLVDKGKFSFKTYEAGVPTIMVTIDGDSKRMGIGTDGTNDNINPAATLDVLGTMKVSGKVQFASTDSSNAFHVAGLAKMTGIESTGTVAFKSTATFYSTITIGTTIIGLPTPTVLPAVTEAVDIGSGTKVFREVWAKTYRGPGTGTAATFYGSLIGNAQGLLNKTTFKIAGDLRTVNVLEFAGDGTGAGGAFIKTFTTELTTSSILSKPIAYTIQPADEVVFYSTTATALTRATKASFLSDLYAGIVPTGGIIPYAGAVLPTGWVWCDGHPYNQTGPGYVNLFNTIGITYGYSAGPTIDFRVPNLNNTTSFSALAENNGPYSLYAGTTTNVPPSSWPIGIKYIIKL